MAGNSDRVGLALPAEGDSIGTIVDGGVGLLGGRSSSTPNQMQLVASVVGIDVIALSSNPGEAKHGARLLTDEDARLCLSGTVARTKLLRIGIGLNGEAIVLRRTHAAVLDVVSPQISSLGTRRRLSDGGKTVPGHTIAVLVLFGVIGVQDTFLSAHLIEPSTGPVPGKSSHLITSLYEDRESVVIEIVRLVMPPKLAPRKRCNGINQE